MQTLLYLLVILVIFLIILTLFLIFRKDKDLSDLSSLVDDLEGPVKDLPKLREDNQREFILLRDEQQKNRQENLGYFKTLEDSLLKRIADNFSTINANNKTLLDSFSKQLIDLTQLNESKLNNMAEQVAKSLEDLRSNNNQKLNEMRETVDEKLQKTLDTRFKNAFDSVGEKLERMHKNLGEMSKLSDEVNNLNKVFSNVKAKGIIGEIQLENLLEDILTPEQYDKNVEVEKNSGRRVEFAIKLPGRGEQAPVWIPIDSKFPLEPYKKYLEAFEKNDLLTVKESQKVISRSLKEFAKDINKKYIHPPQTTDFALLFLPTEGLYGEVIKNVSLIEELRRDLKIQVLGPSTFAAFLNSLHIGFKTLAIEKKTSEVWDLLATFKKDFNKFGGLLEKSHKKIQEAGNVIEDASNRTRIISKRLSKVEDPLSGLSSSTSRGSGKESKALPDAGLDNDLDNDFSDNGFSDNGFSDNGFSDNGLKKRDGFPSTSSSIEGNLF